MASDTNKQYSMKYMFKNVGIQVFLKKNGKTVTLIAEVSETFSHET